MLKELETMNQNGIYMALSVFLDIAKFYFIFGEKMVM